MFDQTVYDKEKLLDHWYTDGYITTPYKRRIKVSRRKAFNYLIQSTTADRVLEKAVIIDELLESKKSFISHIMHDEIVLDFHKDDVKMLPVIKNIFETEDFKTNIKGGKNYFDLEAMTP
jgi:DNA polymerase I-like protein with 3'-5' exonuclease and polymerase domains